MDLNALPLDELYRTLSADCAVRGLLDLMRREDLGPLDRDVTSEACIGADAVLRAEVRAREPAVLAGAAAVHDVIARLGPDVQAATTREDGRRVGRGDAVVRLEGSARGVLRAERPLLNLIGRLSGVATMTSAFLDAMRSAAPDSRARLVDTRKTTPGLRALEKYAVRCGGGMCHRIGLFDAVLIKDNHLAGVDVGGLGAFVETAAAEARASGPVWFVEVEADSLDQLDALLALPPGVVDVVLLDNMTPEMLRRAVARRDERAPGPLLEASGGVTLETVGEIARTGVDRISVGALTHAARSIDFGLDAL